VNQLTDRTADELSMLRGWRHAGKKSRSGRAGVAFLGESAETLEEPPAEVDWKTRLDMALQVPDQGSCGSCWAVATASMLQGSYEAQTNKTRSFSAQQLVNCVPNPKECGGSGGCNGATVELAMQYVEQRGLSDANQVSYEGVGQQCPDHQTVDAASGSGNAFLTQKSTVGRDTLGLSKWHTLPENKALPLMLAVANGPVAISVSAGDWFAYNNGIFDGCSKDTVIDHAVTLFGYGADATSGKKYWTIRNSWGSSWGEDGFIRLLRADTPESEEAYCGTDNDPGSGLACKPYPDSVRVCGMCGLLYDSVAAHFTATV